MPAKKKAFTGAIAVVVVLGIGLALVPANALAQGSITEIIDASGDGAGNLLDVAFGVAVDDAGNVYVTGTFSDNAFQITPAGTITEIIDATGDGAGNLLAGPSGVAVDWAGNVYVAGRDSDSKILSLAMTLSFDCCVRVAERSSVEMSRAPIGYVRGVTVP